MCDTFVVLPEKSSNGSVVFGKNSDRDPNEPHKVQLVDAKTYPSGQDVQCTYRSIPQIKSTHKVLLFKPVWIWGAEMGINEFGVVIGNEAVFSKVKASAEPGLIGMDYLRLGLERASTAFEALKVITSLLEQYGQSGNCGFNHTMVYHNSFLISDSKEAWILETVDKQWIAVKVNSMAAISNAYSIGESWDLKSEGLMPFAKELGYWDGKQVFNFAKVFSDTLYTTFGEGKKRKNCVLKQLSSNPTIGVKHAMNVLRNHDKGDFEISDGLWGNDICMHAGLGPIRASQTTGSIVTSVNKDKINIWFTGASSPCLSMFLPYQFGYDHPIINQQPGMVYEPDSYWWQQETINRLAIFSDINLLSKYRHELFDRETQLLTAIEQTNHLEKESIQTLINEATVESQLISEKWRKEIEKSYSMSNKNIFHQTAWKKFNNLANLKIN